MCGSGPIFKQTPACALDIVLSPVSEGAAMPPGMFQGCLGNQRAHEAEANTELIDRFIFVTTPTVIAMQSHSCCFHLTNDFNKCFLYRIPVATRGTCQMNISQEFFLCNCHKQHSVLKIVPEEAHKRHEPAGL